MPKGTFKAPAFVATLTTLTDEVGDGLYCNRMGISAGQCRSAWLGLCDFIFNVLKKNKVSNTNTHTRPRDGGADTGERTGGTASPHLEALSRRHIMRFYLFLYRARSALSSTPVEAPPTPRGRN